MTPTVKAEPFVKLPRDLLVSDAWRSLSINGRRFIDYLMIEHLRHGGRRNGFLLAPRQQLETFGIGRHYISAAINEVEHAGLVDCRRGTGRHASVYALTWLPLSDGTEASNRWRAEVDKQQPNHKEIMGAVSSIKGCQTAPTKPVAGANQHPQSPKSRGAKQHHPSRKDLTTAKPKGPVNGAGAEPSASAADD